MKWRALLTMPMAWARGRCLPHNEGSAAATGDACPTRLSLPWELRVGDRRVFYEVMGSEPGVVRVLAVGRKRRDVLLIGGKEIRL